MPAFAGFGGRVFVNGTVLRAYHWSVDWRAEEFDITCFENFGVGSYLPGIQDVDLSFDAYYDSTDNPFGPPIALQAGAYDNIVIRFVKTLATYTWTFPNVLCVSCHNETGVRDVIRYTYTGKVSEATSLSDAVAGALPMPPTA